MSGLRLAGAAAGKRRQSRGLSLVEMMVGIAVGLFIVAGASLVTVNQISDNRRLTLETQVQQDLRAAADLVARDLRRAGYWGKAQTSMWYEGGPNVVGNPYTAAAPDANGATSNEVTFSYSRDIVEDDAVDDAKERFGFKLEDDTIKIRVGDAWQALTDPNVLKVTRFDVNLAKTTVRQSCFKACAGGPADTSCWPQQDVRRFTVQIEGQAVLDPSVTRSVTDSVRLRNDANRGACPA